MKLIASHLSISYKSTQHIWRNVFGMKRGLVPKDMNLLQKQRLVDVSKETLNNLAEDNTLIINIISKVSENLANYAPAETVEKKFAEGTKDHPSRVL